MYTPNYISVNNIEDVMKDIALLNIDGMTVQEAKEYLEKDAIPAYGSVNGLIYYSETEPIAQEYYTEIIELIKEFYGDNIPSNLLELNNMTWFAFEYFIGQDWFIKDVLEEAEKLGILEK